MYKWPIIASVKTFAYAPQGLKLLKWAESAEKREAHIKAEQKKSYWKQVPMKVLISLHTCEINEYITNTFPCHNFSAYFH